MDPFDRQCAEYLVVDSTPFINNVQLQYFGKNIITCQAVIDEIRSKRQRRHLLVTPYELIVKDVDPDCYKKIEEFSKKTGDFPTLSATDLKVMALTYQLEKEHVGIDHLATEPVIKRSNAIVTDVKSAKHSYTAVDLPGWGNWAGPNGVVLEESSDEDEWSDAEESSDIEEENDCTEVEEMECSEEKEDFTENGETDKGCSEQQDISEKKSEDDEWVTPKYHRSKQSAKSRKRTISETNSASLEHTTSSENIQLTEKKFVKVACMTTDYSMQNVLKQIKLNVAGINGRIINQLRAYMMRCTSCFTTTWKMTNKFCKKCGYQTLKRVSYFLDENGKPEIYINFKRPLNTRGKRFSLPKFQGGKYAINPHVVEDQRFPQQRLSKLARKKNDPMSDKYIAGYSPFVTRDVTSKSVGLVSETRVKYWMKKNPNESHKRRRKNKS